MPIYEYQCQSCGNVVEQWQRMSDAPLETCEACGGKMSKLISQSSFHLKGSGWYVTDYGADKSGSSPGKSEPTGEAKSKTSADSSKKAVKKESAD